MTDRDRLAADLEYALMVTPVRVTAYRQDDAYYKAAADRLIALGWTRPRAPGVYPTPNGIDVVVDVAESASWVEDEFPDEVAYLIAHAPLDEERLARALARWSEFYGEIEEYAGGERSMVQLDHGHEEYKARMDVMAAYRKDDHA